MINLFRQELPTATNDSHHVRPSFNNGLESHVSALRVRNLFGSVFRLRVPDQRQVPSANGGKGCQRRSSIVGGIGDGPFLLIKRLNYMVVFSQRLPQAKRKSD